MLAENGSADGEQASDGTAVSHEAPAPSALILQFPCSGEQADQRRLRRALAALDTAMAEQRRAVAEWQESLSDLSRAVGGLGGALRRQDEVLAGLASDVAVVNGEAKRLVAWSDSVLTTHG